MNFMYSFRSFNILLAGVLFIFLPACRPNAEYGKWNVVSMVKPAGIPWAGFYWEGDTLGGKFYDKCAMVIPVRVNGLPYDLTMQFDLGANMTQLYGEGAKSLMALHPGTDINKPSLEFGDFLATTANCYIKADYGAPLEPGQTGENRNMRIGTVGSDLFQNKVLIIDYPRQRFSICDSVPAVYATSTVDITLDKYGRAILPMWQKGANYRVLFDNGSSIFPLLAAPGKVDLFSSEKDVDTIAANAWGAIHYFAGRPQKDKVVIAGLDTQNIMVYADQDDTVKTEQYDAIAGNALFWDKVIVIDYKHLKFGIIRNGSQ